MAQITSGTVNATPLGDMWIGAVELAPTADDGDEFSLTTLLGTQIRGVSFAWGVRNSQQSGSVDVQPVSWNASSGTITLGNSGTQGGIETGTIDQGRGSLSDYRRDIFFQATSAKQ